METSSSWTQVKFKKNAAHRQVAHEVVHYKPNPKRGRPALRSILDYKPFARGPSSVADSNVSQAGSNYSKKKYKAPVPPGGYRKNDRSPLVNSNGVFRQNSFRSVQTADSVQDSTLQSKKRRAPPPPTPASQAKTSAARSRVYVSNPDPPPTRFTPTLPQNHTTVSPPLHHYPNPGAVGVSGASSTLQRRVSEESLGESHSVHTVSADVHYDSEDLDAELENVVSTIERNRKEIDDFINKGSDSGISSNDSIFVLGATRNVPGMTSHLRAPVTVYEEHMTPAPVEFSTPVASAPQDPVSSSPPPPPLNPPPPPTPTFQTEQEFTLPGDDISPPVSTGPPDVIEMFQETRPEIPVTQVEVVDTINRETLTESVLTTDTLLDEVPVDHAESLKSEDNRDAVNQIPAIPPPPPFIPVIKSKDTWNVTPSSANDHQEQNELSKVKLKKAPSIEKAPIPITKFDLFKAELARAAMERSQKGHVEPPAKRPWHALLQEELSKAVKERDKRKQSGTIRMRRLHSETMVFPARRSDTDSQPNTPRDQGSQPTTPRDKNSQSSTPRDEVHSKKDNDAANVYPSVETVREVKEQDSKERHLGKDEVEVSESQNTPRVEEISAEKVTTSSPIPAEVTINSLIPSADISETETETGKKEENDEVFEVDDNDKDKSEDDVVLLSQRHIDSDTSCHSQSIYLEEEPEEVGWTPSLDLTDDDSEDDSEAITARANNKMPKSFHMFNSSPPPQPSYSKKRRNKKGNLGHIKKSVKHAIGSISRAVQKRKKIDEMLDENWEIYQSEEFDEVPADVVDIDHIEKRPAYAYHPSKGQLVLLPEYETVIVTKDGKRIQESALRNKAKKKEKKYAFQKTERKREREKLDRELSKAIKAREVLFDEERAKHLQMEIKFQQARNPKGRQPLEEIFLPPLTVADPEDGDIDSPHPPESDHKSDNTGSIRQEDSGFTDNFSLSTSNGSQPSPPFPSQVFKSPPKAVQGGTTGHTVNNSMVQQLDASTGLLQQQVGLIQGGQYMNYPVTMQNITMATPAVPMQPVGMVPMMAMPNIVSQSNNAYLVNSPISGSVTNGVNPVQAQSGDFNTVETSSVVPPLDLSGLNPDDSSPEPEQSDRNPSNRPVPRHTDLILGGSNNSSPRSNISVGLPAFYKKPKPYSPVRFYPTPTNQAT